jgi:hypothetical protein
MTATGPAGNLAVIKRKETMEENKKLAEKREEMNAIRGFIDHLRSNGIRFVNEDTGAIIFQIEDLLFDYYGIDWKKVEGERAALLERARQIS